MYNYLKNNNGNILQGDDLLPINNNSKLNNDVNIYIYIYIY